MKGFTECIANLKPNMQVVNSINANIFGGLVRQLKLYIKQKAVADDCDNEVTIRVVIDLDSCFIMFH